MGNFGKKSLKKELLRGHKHPIKGSPKTRIHEVSNAYSYSRFLAGSQARAILDRAIINAPKSLTRGCNQRLRNISLALDPSKNTFINVLL